MKNIKPISVLIPVGGNSLLMFVVHCLSQINNIKIYIISPNEQAEIKHSGKILNYTFFPNINNENNWIEGINKEIEKFKIDLVMPIDEDGIRNSIKYQAKLSTYSKLVLLPSLQSFEIANNKGLLWKHMLEHHIECPKTFIYNKNQFHSTDSLDFPLILKPLEGFGGGKGIYIFKNKEQLESYYTENDITYPYLIQSYISGYDIDCSVLCEQGEILAYTIQKGTLVGISDFVPKIGLDFLHNDELLHTVKELMLSLNWSGLAHIDMRFDEKESNFKVIEINPRCWESIEGSEIAGVNFPYLHALKSLNYNFETPKYKHTKYLNLLGLKKTIRKNKLFVFNFNFILKYTPIKYFIKDPLPLFLILINKIRSGN
ncbi:MAG: ATP-grasp domain-containing protein [Flavobacteriaceae bacterium]|nr:ATP-grasp domain-containing protein [Flavobacteriaceae bacterium]